MSSLNEICYDKINERYSYGIFGDFRLIVDTQTGFFNATKLCQSGGKRFDNWKRNQNSQELMDYYSTIPSDLRGCEIIYEIQRNINEEFNEIISGTYVRKELFLALSIWISNEFYDKCYKIIEDYYIKDFKSYKDNVQELTSKVNKLKIIENKFKSQKKYLLNKLHKLTDVASPYTDSDLDPCLVIYKKNDLDEIKRPYYAIRTQKRQLDKAIDRLKECYPNAEQVYIKERDPNSIKLFILICKEPFIMDRSGNNFNTWLSDDDLKYEIDNLYKEYFGHN